MKKLVKLLPMAAFAFALVAAFAFKAPVESLFYRDASGVFIEKTGTGLCLEGDFNCEYEFIGSGTPDQNPSNYQPVGEDNRVFMPAP